MRFRSLGPILPDLVDRIALDRDQLGIAGRERFLCLSHPVAGVKPRIIADPRALGRMLLEPLRRTGFGHRLVAPLGRRDLLAHLQGVASIDENRRFLGQHDRRTRRALEPCQPRKALRIAADIFTHMFVGEGDDEPVEFRGLELLAKGLQAIGVTGHWLTPLRPQLVPGTPLLKRPLKGTGGGAGKPCQLRRICPTIHAPPQSLAMKQRALRLSTMRTLEG